MRDRVCSYLKGLTRSIAVFAVAGFGCKERQEPAAAPPPAAVARLAAEGPKGAVHGVVRFSGPFTRKPPQQVSADLVAACGAEVEDRSVLLHDGALENALVTVDGAPLATTPPGKAQVDQHGCAYLPPVVLARAGGQLAIVNSDQALHNVRGKSGAANVFNVAMPLPQTITRPLPQAPGVVELKCDVHPWMHGWVAVVDHELAALTSAAGEFRLDGVPAGARTLTVWHPVLGTTHVSATVAEGQVAEVAVDLAAH
ncbi:MAG: hypothetical protein K1X89_08550 [Myxococcaceae bacterium]|nr:hypothetical protein [Myxococcaceae bacterium]